jgi:hypothetical protein
MVSVDPNRRTGRNYKAFLENNMPDFLVDVPLIIRRELHFMHDGAPANFSLVARRYLNRKLPSRWMGRGGPIAWSPRSPDLNPLDFYFWGHLKSFGLFVSSGNSQKSNFGRFSDNTQHARIWDRLRVAMRHQAETRIQAEGGHMEHLP